jgi:hypothetical protein
MLNLITTFFFLSDKWSSIVILCFSSQEVARCSQDMADCISSSVGCSRLRNIGQIPTALPSFGKVCLHSTNRHPVFLSRKVKSTVYWALSRRHVRSTSWATFIKWLRKRCYTVCPPIYRCWTGPSQNSQRITSLRIAGEVSVRFHLANVSKDIDIVRAKAEFPCFEDIPRQ